VKDKCKKPPQDILACMQCGRSQQGWQNQASILLQLASFGKLRPCLLARLRAHLIHFSDMRKEDRSLCKNFKNIQKQPGAFKAARNKHCKHKSGQKLGKWYLLLPLHYTALTLHSCLRLQESRQKYYSNKHPNTTMKTRAKDSQVIKCLLWSQYFVSQF